MTQAGAHEFSSVAKRHWNWSGWQPVAANPFMRGLRSIMYQNAISPRTGTPVIHAKYIWFITITVHSDENRHFFKAQLRRKCSEQLENKNGNNQLLDHSRLC
jgi:hypothetical protein